MTDILPIAGWPNVRQLETNEFATGGANGNMNEQAKSLAARSELLKQYAALPYESKTGGYALNERVQLATGDIVKSTVANNINDPNVNMTGWEIPKNGIESISDLRALRPVKKGERVYLISANNGQSEGGGTFVATQKSGLVDNGGTIISSPDPLIFWVRVNYDDVNFEMFGAKGNDPTFDSYQAIQNCFDSVPSIKAEGKKYYISEGLVLPNSLKSLKGVTQTVTEIIKTTQHEKLVNDGTSVDFAIYIAPESETADITYYKKLSDFSVSKSSGVLDSGVGIYAHKIALSQLNNIRMTRFDLGFHSKDTWMTTFDRVTAQCNNGFKILSGTSSVFTACWTIGCGGTCYDFQNLLYSTMIGCGADFSGWEGNPCKAVLSIMWSELTIIGMGYEKSHLERFAYIHQSRVSIENLRGLLIENRYRQGYGGWLDIVSQSTVTLNNCGFGLQYGSNGTTHANMPSPVYLANESTLTDTDSNLFKSYSTGSAIVLSSNLIVDTDGERVERILIPTSKKSIRTNRTFVSNDGFSTDLQADQILDNGHYHSNVDGSTMSYNMLVHVAHKDIRSAAWQMGIPVGYTNAANLQVRVKNTDVWSTPVLIRNGNNTIVDGSGFIKSASPVVRVYADHIETNEDADKQNIEFEKLGIGDYLIKGSSGFSNDGWYIETPKDANGNILFAVVYTTLENEDISIKTYRKKFDIETASIVADVDNPVDIKDTRWIDIRLNEAD